MKEHIDSDQTLAELSQWDAQPNLLIRSTKLSSEHIRKAGHIWTNRVSQQFEGMKPPMPISVPRIAVPRAIFSKVEWRVCTIFFSLALASGAVLLFPCHADFLFRFCIAYSQEFFVYFVWCIMLWTLMVRFMFG